MTRPAHALRVTQARHMQRGSRPWRCTRPCTTPSAPSKRDQVLLVGVPRRPRVIEVGQVHCTGECRRAGEPNGPLKQPSQPQDQCRPPARKAQAAVVSSRRDARHPRGGTSRGPRRLRHHHHGPKASSVPGQRRSETDSPPRPEAEGCLPVVAQLGAASGPVGGRGRRAPLSLADAWRRPSSAPCARLLAGAPPTKLAHPRPHIPGGEATLGPVARLRSLHDGLEGRVHGDDALG
jgi:hypothetical protein